MCCVSRKDYGIADFWNIQEIQLIQMLLWLNGTLQSEVSESRSVMSDSMRPNGLYSPWNSPGQNTGVGSQYLLQGVFPTQGSNPGTFSRESSQPRDRTQVSHIVGGFFTSWATREGQGNPR